MSSSTMRLSIPNILIVVFTGASIDRILAENTPQACPADYVYNPKTNNCYKLSPGYFWTWYEARARCVTEGGDLVVISDEEEDDFLRNRVIKTSHSAWIGLQRHRNASQIQWVDGSPLNYSRVNDQYFSYRHETDCFWLIANSAWFFKYWYPSRNCDYSRSYLCEKPAEIYPTCPSGYVSNHNPNMCYKVQPSLDAFEDSRANCEFDGGELASISSPVTKAYIISLIKATILDRPGYWVGLRKPNETGSIFEWLDGNPLDETETINFSLNLAEDCGTLHYRSSVGYFYSDQSCSEIHPSICQKHVTQNDYPTFDCPYGYQTNVNQDTWRISCLLMEHRDPKPWPNATEDCSAMGGELYRYEEKELDVNSYMHAKISLLKSFFWSTPDRCEVFPVSAGLERPCEELHPYICHHWGVVRLLINLSQSKPILGDICQAISTSTTPYRSTDGTIYLSHTSNIAHITFTQMISEDYVTECVFHTGSNNCCIQATLTQPGFSTQEMKIQMDFPLAKSLICLCPELATLTPVTPETVQLLRNVTTPTNDSTAPPNSLCPCRCDTVRINFDQSPELVAEMVSKIQRELKVDTTKLSSKRNKKVSAADSRSESCAMGYVGILLCIVPFALIIAVDLAWVFRPKNRISDQPVS